VERPKQKNAFLPFDGEVDQRLFLAKGDEFGGRKMRLKLLAAAMAGFVVAGPALAADLPAHSAPPAYLPPPPPVFTWTGVYLGVQAGYEWGTTSTNLLTNPGATFAGGLPGYSQNGVTGGAHLGMLVQSAHFVYGVEGDVEGSSFKGSQAVTGALTSVSTREDINSSFRLRFGYAWDRTLFYATGGVAIADFNNSYNNAGVGLDSDGHTRFGWTVGGGVAYAITNNLSVRAEYRYTDFGSTNDVLANSTGGALQTRVHESDNAVRVGISYNFSMAPPPAPVVAKY
jgi:outer membrane immunogenic protein